MDLISVLVNAKEKESVGIEEYLNELIKYEKLAKLPKFQHIADSPILQKQMPKCWAAFNKDPFAVYMVTELIGCLQTISDTPLVMTTDLQARYTKKEYKQYYTIGLGATKPFKFKEAASMSSEAYQPEIDGRYVLTEDRDGILYYSIIYDDGETYNVYTGNLRNVAKKALNAKQQIEPFEAHGVSITAYSNQGNNDYDFAETKEAYVSMPENGRFRFTWKDDESTTEVNLSSTQMTEIGLKMNNLDWFTQLIADVQKRCLAER